MAFTSTQQRNAVSEGAALGLLMCGRETLPGNKTKIDLAFSGAWRIWSYRDRFSQVSTDLRNGIDPIYVLTRADYNKKVWNLYWDRSRVLTIHRRDTWVDIPIDVDDIADSVGGDVPASGWKKFAKDFLARLDR